MKRTMLLVRSNIRKAKGQTVAIIMLVLLSSIMMNLWLMLSTDYKKNFERSHTKVNDGHVTIAAYTDEETFREFVTDMLSGSDEVTEFSVRDALCSPGSFSYGGGEIMASLVILNKDTALCADVGKVELTEESDLSSGIYLPMLYGSGDNYCVGDTMELALGSETLECTVCGFFNSPMMGSHNCTMTMMLLTEDKFRALSEGNAVYPSTCISLRLTDRAKSEEMKTLLLDSMTEAFPDVMFVSNSYEEVSESRYISSMICAGILSVMAFLVLLIGVAVIASNVANTIQDQMQNLGALKAVGYRSRQLVSSFVMQLVVISVLAAVIGCALSYCIFPAISGMMVSQTGIPYQIRVLPVPFFATIGFIISVVALTVLLSAKKIKKIEPITAIRQGVATHHFKKNAVPLDLTRLPLQIALSMKTASSGLKQNITIGITMLVLSLIIVFSGLMFENVIMDIQPFVDMFVGESADSGIDVNVSRESEFLSAMKTDSRVEKMHLYTSVNVQHIDGSSLTGMIYDDFSKCNNQNIIIEG
ncbi:MAG: ABC transporter permease, partial [Lachnospiraceae bacterium]|nr:ABC transporter permease [Lachnospiraceae bacterium]